MADVGDGLAAKQVELEHRFRFMSSAAVAIRPSDGTVAHCSGDAILGCFEGASAADSERE